MRFIYLKDPDGNDIPAVADADGNLRMVIVDGAGEDVNPAKEKICLASYTEDDISLDAIDLTGIEGEITRIELNNDGVTDITITIGSISKTIKGGEFYNQNFQPFTSIGVTGDNPVFRLDVLG